MSQPGPLAGRIAAPALLAVLFWAGAVWAWPDTALSLTFDDSFYYFEIASNLAAGHGATFDRIEPTNGFHPLWLALCAIPFAAGLEGLAAVRAILYAQLAMWAGAILLLARTAVDAMGAWPREPDRCPTVWLTRTAAALVLLVTVNPFMVRVFANGMESALYALCYGALLAVAARAPSPLDLPRPSRVGLGALLGLAVLARTDATLLVGVLALWSLPEVRRRGWPGAIALAEIVAIPTAVTVAFLVANQAWFGTPLQVSGELKRVPLSAPRVAWVLMACVAPALGVAYVTARGGTRFPRTARLLRRTGWFVVFGGALVAYYTGLQTFARLWYFGPLVYYGLLIAIVATADLLQIGLDDAPAKPPRRALGPVVLLVLGPFAAGLLVQSHRFVQPGFAASRMANRDAGMWLTRNVDPDAVVASWDAGVLAFFAEPRVVNLDGVVNSAGYAAALRTGTTARYLAGHGIRYVANHDGIEGGDERMREDATRILGGRVARWQRVRTWPFAFTGSTNATGPSSTHDMAVFLFDLDPPAAPEPPRLRRVALTLDDYPYQTGAEGPTEANPTARAQVSAAIRRALAAHRVTAAVFVNCAWADEDGVLRWAEAGHAVGNHTSRHLRLDTAGVEAWSADTTACHGILADLLGTGPAWFRYPYLDRGATVATRDQAAASIAALPETDAPVSVPTSEWLLSQHYDVARAAGDEARMRAITQAYVEHTVEALERAEALANDRIGRPIAHITLAHVNHLNADALDRVLTAVEAAGWTWLSLDQALADPVYDEPDTFVGSAAVPWPARVAEGEPDLALWFGREEDRLARWLEEGPAP